MRAVFFGVSLAVMFIVQLFFSLWFGAHAESASKEGWGQYTLDGTIAYAFHKGSIWNPSDFKHEWSKVWLADGTGYVIRGDWPYDNWLRILKEEEKNTDSDR